MSIVSMKKMLENGVHFGHQTRRWNPKMKPFIYTSRNGVYIVDLNQTQAQIEAAYNELKAISERGGKVLFVGTKKQAAEVVEEQALRSGSFYVNKRWLGGLLTNFRTIQKRIKRLVEIEEMEASGKIEVYTKKEQANLRKEKAKLEGSLGGIKEMKKLPDALVVIDPKEEQAQVGRNEASRGGAGALRDEARRRAGEEGGSAPSAAPAAQRAARVHARGHRAKAGGRRALRLPSARGGAQARPALDPVGQEVVRAVRKPRLARGRRLHARQLLHREKGAAVWRGAAAQHARD